MRTCSLQNPQQGIPTLKACFGYLLVGTALRIKPSHHIELTMATEHIMDTQVVSNAVGALFGIYLFYTSQMHSKDKLHAISRIPIPIGQSLLSLWIVLTRMQTNCDSGSRFQTCQTSSDHTCFTYSGPS
jgi:hypothetical protein